jgi:hypothetical protein
MAIGETVESSTRKLQSTVNKKNWKIWGFHGGDYEEWCLLGCYAVWFL